MNQNSRNVNGGPVARRSRSGDFLRVRHLRLLQLVQQGGSLAAASRELHLSQPAVTKMLHELEAAFGAALVTRGARGGTLTPQGLAALQRLRLALAQVDTALDAARSGRPEIPTLRIGILPLVSVALMQAVLRQLWKSRTPLRLMMQESTASGLLQALAAGKVDCVLGRAEPDALAVLEGAKLKQVPLTQEQLVFACGAGHPLARKRRIELPLLLEQEWVLAAAGSHTRRLVDTLFLSRGLQPPVPVVESMSFHTNLLLVQAIGACTVAPLSAVTLYGRMGLVQVLKVHEEFLAGPLSLMYLETAEDLPAVRTFCDTVRAVAAGL